MSRIAACILVVVVACSSGATSTPGPAVPAPPTTPDATPAPVGVTREQCEEIVMHVVDLTVAEQGSAAAGDRDTVRAKLEPFVAECTTLAPEIATCVLAAKTLAEVSACQPSAGDAK